jgi:hypothetical protein
MRRGSLFKLLRRGRASWSVAILYLLLLPILLGILPKPAPTAEFLLLHDLAASEICTMRGSAEMPGEPMEHRPDCILCSTACPFSGSLAAVPPADAAAHPYYLQFAFLGPQPKDFALPAFGLFTSDIQSRGPPTSI